jgi:acyl carrier protein
VAAANGYRAAVTWSPGRDDGSVDATFFRDEGTITSASVPSTGSGAWERYANRPLSVHRRAELATELLAYLRARLPAPMIPASMIALEALPTTAAGKVDVAALPPPARAPASPYRRASERNPTEAALAALWTEILGIDEIPRDENFFDLGGDSLDVIRLVDLIEKELGPRISPVAVFKEPTLAGLARVVRGDGDSAWARMLDSSRKRGLAMRSRRVGGPPA